MGSPGECSIGTRKEYVFRFFCMSVVSIYLSGLSILDWQLGRKQSWSFWLRMPAVGLPLYWSGGWGEVAAVKCEQVTAQCSSLLMFLLRFSRFSWLQVFHLLRALRIISRNYIFRSWMVMSLERRSTLLTPLLWKSISFTYIFNFNRIFLVFYSD